ncbi:MAG: cytochrome c oxidase assembly protein [Gemmatimonadota bacterium]|nr:cytochrome c oxidase assembly protein [Gemmatimonadota bacterium]
MIAAAVLLHRESFSWTEWTIYPSFLIGWLLLEGAYMLCAGPLRRFFPGSRSVPPLRLASFAAGMTVMLLALQGPLHELSDYFLFSAHMVQHLLLILVMPPLLLAGVPDWMVRPALRVPGMLPLARLLTFPVIAFALNNAIFLAWHFPGPYDLMMRNHDVHITMHTMIMISGTIMWWPVMSPLPELPRIAPPLQMVYLFVLGIPMMISAALITLADHAMYQWYVEAPRIWDLSPLEDQQQGGAIMWVPGALTIWLGITAVYFRWTHREMKEDDARTEGRSRPSRAGMVWTPPPFPERR